MVSKKSSVFFSVFVCIAGAALFYLKYSVMEIEDRIRVAKKGIAVEKNNQRILKAEWKELTTPERIHRLAVKHLNMVQMDSKQLREYDPALFHDIKHKKDKSSTKRLSSLISEILKTSEDDE